MTTWSCFPSQSLASSVHLPLIPKWESKMSSLSRSIKRYLARLLIAVIVLPMSLFSRSSGNGKRSPSLRKSTPSILLPTHERDSPVRTVSTSGSSGITDRFHLTSIVLMCHSPDSLYAVHIAKPIIKTPVATFKLR